LQIICIKDEAMNIPETMRFLQAVGKRITPKRRLLLCIISDNVHLHASEIYDPAKDEDPRISLSTVYRTVKLLKEHYHRICLGCGKVAEIPTEVERLKAGELLKVWRKGNLCHALVRKP